MEQVWEKMPDIVGIIGVIIILVAYYWVSMGRYTAKNFNFQALNFLGAWLILFSLYFHWNLSSVLIEIAWIIISMIGMYRIIKETKKGKMTQ
jgi:hypothetical protein